MSWYAVKSSQSVIKMKKKKTHTYIYIYRMDKEGRKETEKVSVYYIDRLI